MLGFRLKSFPILLLLAAALVAMAGCRGCETYELSDGLPQDVNCSTCHGNEENPAPPNALNGSELTSYRGVGAHQDHLHESYIRPPVKCSECHQRYYSIEQDGHFDPLPADLTWGPLASANGADPSFDRDTDVCSNVYCHGSTLYSGSNSEPVWTIVDGSQSECGTCHASPPPPPHIDFDNCNLCHPCSKMEDCRAEFPNELVVGTTHINGVLDLRSLECNACHGNAVNAGPPRNLNGDTATTELTVGAHQSHLVDGPLAQAFDCTACHIYPEAVSSPGHIDILPAEVTWGTLAQNNGVIPDWDRDNAACNSTYCHGVTLGGGTNKTPTWNVVDGSQSACGTCHGAPPPDPHPQGANCDRCHPTTVMAGGNIDVAGGFHVNGTIEVATGCDQCHGNPNNVAPFAPPFAVDGSNDTTSHGVGAHQEHLGDGVLTTGISCNSCHIVPGSVNDPGHLDGGFAELTWGSISSDCGLSPDYNFVTNTCSSNYCHGATLGGGVDTSPVWTVVDGSQKQCDSCHGYPPAAPHPPVQNTPDPSCAACHQTLYDYSCSGCHSQTINEISGIMMGFPPAAGSIHIDGQLQMDLDGACDNCHAAAPPTGAHAVHYAAGPDYAEYGDSGVNNYYITSDFPASVTGGYAFNCVNCHPTEISRHGDGDYLCDPATVFADIDLDPSTAPAGSLRAKNDPNPVYWVPDMNNTATDSQGFSYYRNGRCNNIYCHSRTTYQTMDIVNNPVVPGNITNPGVDFEVGIDSNGKWVYPIVYPDYEVPFGEEDYKSSIDERTEYRIVNWEGTRNCSGCHDFPPRFYDSEVTAAVGDSHSWVNTSADPTASLESMHGYNHNMGPISCSTCHAETVTDPGVRFYGAITGLSVYRAVPINNYRNHVNGEPTIAFTSDPIDYVLQSFNPPKTITYTIDPATAGYDPSTRTCTNIACHHSQTIVEWGQPFRRENTLECDSCHRK